MTARARLRYALVALVVAGCSQTTAIDLTLELVGSAAGRAADARTLDLHVDGDVAPFATTLDVAGKFAGGKATLEYRPKTTSGTLTFTLTLRDAAGGVIGTGSGSAVVRAHNGVALTISIGEGGMAGDLGVGPDLSNCKSGDGQCSPGCDATNDTDCPSICGNQVVEPGEACDDGNQANGDGCDPTCHFANTLSILSGHAGSVGFADGIGETARFNLPNGMTTDGTYLYVTDVNVIRRVDPVTRKVTTLAGLIGDSTLKNGPGATARFNEPFDLAWHSTLNKLYVIDNSDNTLRSIDLGSPTFDVATVADSSKSIYPLSPASITFDGSSLVVLDSRGVTAYTPAGAGTVIATIAQLQAQGASFPLYGVGWNGNLPAYLVSMGSKIFKVTSGGVVSLFAGTTTASCVDGALGTGTMKSANRLLTGGTLYMVDSGCEAIRTFNGGSISTYAGNGMFGDGSIPPQPDIRHIGFRTADALAFVGGTLYVLEEDGGRIRKVTPTDTSVLAGSASFTSGVDKITYGGASTSRYGGLVPSPSGFWTSATLATDGQNAWAVGSNGDLIQVSLADGSSQTFTTIPSVSGLTRIGSKLYLASNGNLLTWDTGTKMLANYTTAGGITGAYLTNDGTNFYWIDGTTIKKMDANKAITVVAGTAGTKTVADGTGTAASFAFPIALTSDGKQLYLLDSAVAAGRLVVRQIDPVSQVVKTIAGKDGVQGAVDGAALDARFAGAFSLATDGTSLFIGDAGEGAKYGERNGPTIRQLVLATGQVTTMMGTRGQFSAAPGVGTSAIVNMPSGMIIDIPSRTFLFYDAQEDVFERIK